MDNSLDQLHAAYTTHPDEIAAVVARITTHSIINQAKIVGGIDNEAHTVTTAHGEHLVVHIRRHGELPFEDIAWGVNQARSVGVPAPEVLYCGHARLDGVDREVMIQRKLLGQPLSALLPTLDGRQLRTCCLQWSAMLAMLHRVPVEGFGMRRNGVWDFPTWETMTSRLAPGDHTRRLLGAAGLTETEIDALTTALERLRQRFPCPQPALLHGDWKPGHLLFDADLNLCGILDFGQFQGGDPIVDIDLILPDLLEGELSEWYRRLHFDDLREGYGPAPVWEHFTEHRLLYVLNEYVSYFVYHSSIGDTATVARLVPRTRALLEIFDGYQ